MEKNMPTYRTVLSIEIFNFEFDFKFQNFKIDIFKDVLTLNENN